MTTPNKKLPLHKFIATGGKVGSRPTTQGTTPKVEGGKKQTTK